MERHRVADLEVLAWGKKKAPPLLYWHGMGPLNPGALMLNETAPQWADAGLRVLAPNAPGFGESPPVDDYSVRSMAARAVAVLDELGLEHTSFAGYSWGGRVGLRLPPNRIDALVLLDSGYSPRNNLGTVDDLRASLAAEWPSWGSWDEVLEAAREHITLSAHAMERLQAACVEREGRIVSRVQLEVVAAALGAIRAEPDGEWWSNWRETQILLLTRAEPNEEDLATFTAALPHANVHRVPGAGHDVLTDNPGFVVPHVTKFLRGV